MNPTCILCGTATNPFVEHSLFGTYYHCEHCDLIFKDEKDRVDTEEEHAIYESHENAIDDPRYVAFFYRFLDDAVFPYVKEPVKGLDFGSGPSPVLAEVLRRDKGYDMEIYDLFYSPEKVYEGKTYNLITCTEVVEHLADPLPIFRQWKELLAPDGILAIMTLFHQNDPDVFTGWHYIRDRSHIAFYTPKTMAWIADSVGMELLHTDGNRYTTFTHPVAK